MKLVNHRTGHVRTVSFGGAIAGSLFLGPLYLLFKGVWTWGLLTLALNLLLGAIAFPLLILMWLIWAFTASTMIESFYRQRGFEVPENCSNAVVPPPPPPAASFPRPSGQPAPYSFAEDRVMQFVIILAAIAAATAAAIALSSGAQAQNVAYILAVSK